MATFGLLGLRVGAQPIGDNSTFVHIRTGVHIATHNAIPRSDPYSFTARGKPWIVQSWLAEWIYGLANRVGGIQGIVVEHGVLYAGLAVLVARLARTGSSVRTAAAASAAIAIGIVYWAPRPLAFGLVCFALTVTIVEDRLSPLWLVPVVWVWANSHGSFMLGIAWLVAIAAGEAIDARSISRQSLRYAAAFAGGIVVAAVNPLGPKVLLFPLQLVARREVVATVVEWGAPSFDDARGAFVLAGLVSTLALLLRARPAWRDALPVLGFLALGLLAQRNLPMLGVVAAPALGRALQPARAPAGEGVVAVDRETGISERRMGMAVVASLAIAAAVFVAGALRAPGIDKTGYPTAALSILRRDGGMGPESRVVAQDTVGGYLVLTSPDSPVFIDDRVDMYPLAVSRDYRHLLDGRRDSVAILRRWKATAVIWETRRPLVSLLSGSDTWTRAYERDGWSLFVRS